MVSLFPSLFLGMVCTSDAFFMNVMNRLQFRRICMESMELTGLISQRQFAPECLFWQVGLLDVVLSWYPNKSHNFTNLIFYDVTLKDCLFCCSSEMIQKLYLDIPVVGFFGIVTETFTRQYIYIYIFLMNLILPKSLYLQVGWVSSCWWSQCSPE